jgi:aldehyde:ferredoxin oxidoreductase
MNGYCEQILRINLSNKDVKTEPLSENVQNEFIGGKGFGSKILYDELKSDIDPLSPENKLIFATGPFTATTVPTANRYGVFFKSPLTKIFGESYSAGYFAPEIKRSGYDIVIIEGKSDSPTYLKIEDSSIEFLDATKLWGKDTYETQEILRKDLGPKFQVACIGQGGENLVNFACICNGDRQAGRCGAGAVMGSKLLKAIAIHGTGKVNVADETKLSTLVKKILEAIPKDLPMRKYGTSVMVDLENKLGTFPTRYWSKGVFEKADKINAEAMAKEIVERQNPCWRCPIVCGKLSHVREGKYAGTKVDGPDYETIYAFGGLCEIGDIKAIAKANELCDRFGIDTMSAGNLIAFAMKAYESGQLNTDYKLNFGDDDSVMMLIEKIAKKEGLGETLALGIKGAADKLGLQDIAVHVKGLEPAGYDPRGLKGSGLMYAVSTRGACHCRSSIYALESRGAVDRFATDGKAALQVNWEERLTLVDSLIICNFIRNFVDIKTMAELCEAVIGFNASEESLTKISKHIINQIRMFNIREGISSKDDVLPKYITENPLPSGYAINQSEVEKMVKEYYQLRGWSENGKPST